MKPFNALTKIATAALAVFAISHTALANDHEKIELAQQVYYHSMALDRDWLDTQFMSKSLAKAERLQKRHAATHTFIGYEMDNCTALVFKLSLGNGFAIQDPHLVDFQIIDDNPAIFFVFDAGEDDYGETQYWATATVLKTVYEDGKYKVDNIEYYDYDSDQYDDSLKRDLYRYCS